MQSLHVVQLVVAVGDVDRHDDALDDGPRIVQATNAKRWYEVIQQRADL